MGLFPSQEPDSDFSGEKGVGSVGPGSTGGLSPAELADLGVPGSETKKPSLWDTLLDVAGALGTKPTMPGTTIGKPAGASNATGALPPTIPLPQGQMQTPPGMGAYFKALQNPTGGNQGLIAQYMALQQLMRGS